HGNDKADAKRATLEKIYAEAKQQGAKPEEFQRLAVFFAMTHYHGDSFAQTAFLLLHALDKSHDGTTPTLEDWKRTLIAGREDTELVKEFATLPAMAVFQRTSADALYNEHKDFAVDAKWTYVLALRWLGACLQNIDSFNIDVKGPQQNAYITINKAAEKLLADHSALPLFERERLEIIYNTLHITYLFEHPGDKIGMAAQYNIHILPHANHENNLAARMYNLMFVRCDIPDIRELYARTLIGLLDTYHRPDSFWFCNTINNLSTYYQTRGNNLPLAKELTQRAVDFATQQNDTKAYYALWYTRHALLLENDDPKAAQASVMSALNIMEQHTTFNYTNIQPHITQLKKKFQID
ncbi:MAG: hypothetical protein KDK65_06605, partial [Chlamydiia bacterium]|nr:hypothetical protein [Chlamydiia bacterium]